MPGDVPDPVLVEARRALLDALEALSGHLDHIVLARRPPVEASPSGTRGAQANA